MPLFDHKCNDCCFIHEALMPVDDPLHDCPHCGGVAKRCFTSQYYINPDIDYVTDNVTGDPKRYTSRKQLEKDLAEKGLYQKYGKGWW